MKYVSNNIFPLPPYSSTFLNERRAAERIPTNDLQVNSGRAVKLSAFFFSRHK